MEEIVTKNSSDDYARGYADGIEAAALLMNKMEPASGAYHYVVTAVRALKPETSKEN